jgi:hypothetical protein
LSKVRDADKIKTPMLLIHGVADDNDGTFPIQSDRMYQGCAATAARCGWCFAPRSAWVSGARQKGETALNHLWRMIQEKNVVPCHGEKSTPARVSTSSGNTWNAIALGYPRRRVVIPPLIFAASARFF